MADAVPQTFQNHHRLVTLYHKVAFPILAVYLVWTTTQAIVAFAFATVLDALVAFALIIIFFYARIFALTVQNRLIRLEMRLRMRELLPDDLRPQIDRFTVPQLVAMRFASDAELPDLARKVIADNISDRTAIKKMIQDWQGDHVRV